jgi:molybdate/tungstate transport system ATP-binding protein
MLEVNNIGVSLGSFSMKNISLKVEPGDYLTVLGLSGAGKTVLLEILAGIVAPDEGTVYYKGKDISKTAIQKRPFGLVYQDMALFPHMTVQKNIEYPMKCRKVNASEIKPRVQELAGKMRITHLLQRHPATLSGGEAQRVALARILASDAEVLLLDEPLASLDVKLKQELRELLKEINQSGKTIIHVTHDHMEAATLSKNIAIIEDGCLLQWGRPEDVFRKPVSEFVARFSGIRNIFLCKFQTEDASNDMFEGISEKGLSIKLLIPPDKESAHLMIPGEDIIVSEQPLETSAVNQYKGVIKDAYYLNHGVELIIQAGEDFSVMVSQKSAQHMELKPGKPVWISFKASAVKPL